MSSDIRIRYLEQRGLYRYRKHNEEEIDMPHCFLTIGLPGCGKSTYAEKINQDNGAQIIERDRIRQMLYGIFDNERKARNYYQKPNIRRRERKVSRVWEYLLRLSIEDNENIVLSDTFMNRKHVRNVIDRFLNNGYRVTVVSFLDIPVDVVMSRNKNRQNAKRVPHKAMENFIAKIPDMQSFIDEIDGKVEVVRVAE